MADEQGKSSSGASSPIAHVLEPGRRQLIIAPRRAQPWSAGRPLTAGAVRAVIAQVPGLEVVRVLRSRSEAGSPARVPDGPSDVFVVRADPDRAELLKQTMPPQLLVEEDTSLEYGSPTGSTGPAPSRLTSWSAAGAIETRPIRFRVVGDGDRPLAGAGVSLTGEGFPQEGRTDKRGEVTLPMIGLPGRRARSLLVTAPSNYWDHYLSEPELSDAEINVVRLRAIDETIAGFPGHFRYGWGQLQMGLDRVPEHLTGKGVKVALIDSGVDTSHPLLRHIGAGVDLTNEADRRTWTQDIVGHGTHCAGILAARDDSGKMLRGFVPDAEIHVLKVFPGGQFSNLLEALDYCAEAEIDVVNLSLGSPRRSYAVEGKLEDLALRGIACVVAAGNTGGPVQYPASSPYTLAIGAVGRLNSSPDTTWDATTVVPELVAPDGIFSPTFTSVGPEVALCAPGVAIVSTVPGGFEPLSGTSMAVPHVAGLAALLLAHHPLFQGPLAARTAQRVAALFAMIRGLCIPSVLGQARTGAGLPSLTGVEHVLRPSVQHQRDASGRRAAGNGRAATGDPSGAGAWESSPAPGAPLGTSIAGAMADPWSGAPVYLAAQRAIQEWPYHALLETLRQQYGGWG